ncbi:DrmB family protein [Ruegeria lacuscaerulensis]|uniref:DrmB family protein n=1 Tax=Ruegeria lacuscaerulensis TaxID=55218 RepID=UPI00147A51A7|nr:DrmB family protein [Ruegeria lacuscaerulensis]
MKNDLQELRRSAVVSTFGPGSVVDFRSGGGAVSGIAAGLEEWDQSFPPAGLAHPQVIRETRLQKKLGVKGFRTPPVILERGKDDDPDLRRLVAVRFPKWLQCPNCDVIKPERRWKNDPGEAYRYCPKCTEASHGDSKVFVIPVRFVMACKNGHIDEFPWDWWVGHKPGCKTAKRENSDRHRGLRLRSESPGLAGLILSCPECGARRSMDGVFSKKTWEHGPKCRGLRPWLANGNENCGNEQYAVQRGASNLYFPVTESALSIPPWSDRLQEVLGDWWSSLTNLDDHSKLEEYIELLAKGDLESILRELEMSPAELAEAIRARLTSFGQLRTDDLRPAEYRQFVTEPGRSRTPDIDFETRREAVPSEISPWISRVVRAVRLREVRAIKGFTRINPPGDPDSSEVARLSKEALEWLPAIEVRGEGVFLALNEEKLAKWERRDDVINRVSECEDRHLADWRERYGDDAAPQQQITPRYMLCHTLSHALMRQLTLECGYSSASLQERIYAGCEEEQMAGLLVYTATPDADGTLGGLERQGKAGRIEGILQRSLEAIEWCSSDPLCITDMMGALNSYSHSVCHACCLVPETSCEAFNSFLDRALLTGDGSGSGLGFFEDMLRRS